MAVDHRLKRCTPAPRTTLLWTTIITVQLFLVFVYLVVTDATPGLFHLYPIVWITVGLWAIWWVDPPAAPSRSKRIAGGFAVGYFLVLAYFGGFLREGHAYHGHAEFTPEQADFVYGFDLVLTLPPGYGPALTYSGPTVMSAITPYLLIGFIALTYLMYVTVLDAGGDASVGLVGVFSCVGCSFPLIAALVGAGGTTAVTTMVYANAYALSTAAFVATVGFLCWRPFDARNARGTLVAVGGALLLVSATVHLALGLEGVLAVLTADGDRTLPVLFLGFAVVVYALVGGYRTDRIQRVHAVSIAAVLAFLAFVFYVDWHLLGVADAVLPLESVGLEHSHDHNHDHADDGPGGHGGGFLEDLGAHLRADLAALLAKSAEFVAFVLLGTVAVQEWVLESAR